MGERAVARSPSYAVDVGHLTRSGLVYIPHLRHCVPWEIDRTDWPFVPLNYEPQTDAERAALGRLDRYDIETDAEYTARKRMRDHAMRYGRHFLSVPLADEPEFEAYARDAQDTYLRDMAVIGWWDIENDRGSLRALGKPIEIDITDLPEDALMAHAMHAAGLFESIGEARRNGWNKPIAAGLYAVGKPRRRVVIKAPTPPTIPRSGRHAVYHARFTTGDDLVFSMFEHDEPDPEGIWAIWCRSWSGEVWKYYWGYTSGPRSKAIERYQHEACLMITSSPAPALLGGPRRRIENIWISADRIDQNPADEMGRLAVQVERSRACIDGRAPRQFVGCSARYI